jgi:hypothetical protein
MEINNRSAWTLVGCIVDFLASDQWKDNLSISRIGEPQHICSLMRQEKSFAQKYGPLENSAFVLLE